MDKVEQFDFLEVSFEAEYEGIVIEDCCIVCCGDEFDSIKNTKKLSAYRKGDRLFAVRILAEKEGNIYYRIHVGDIKIEGSFWCGRNRSGLHGKVCTDGDTFVYSDGSKFLPFGTTCYNWINQSQSLQDQTLDTLSKTCFNKIRMLVFPKYMPYNQEEPEMFPFERTGDETWNINRIFPAFWDNMDRRIGQLRDMGIQADLILFHPYDKWGFADLTREESTKYMKYCIARYSAYTNIWWSLANEYELVLSKTEEDWDTCGRLLMDCDPYDHLRSIHQIISIYPKKSWMTHCSIQSGNINYLPKWKKIWKLPIIIDECGYEGNIEYDWGNLSAFEMVNRFWWTITRGGYCTHGETFHSEDEILWWSKGGLLYGESERRIAFLKDLLEGLPGVGCVAEYRIGNPNEKTEGETPADRKFRELLETCEPEMRDGVMDSFFPKELRGEGWRLRYYGHTCPCRSTWNLGEDADRWKIEIIDVWNMTKDIYRSNLKGEIVIKLPAKPGMAVLATRIQ